MLETREIIQNCAMYKQEDLAYGTATVTLERGEMLLVFRKVPAMVCEACREEHVDEEITGQLLAAAEVAAESGVQVDVREYVAA